MRPCGTAGQQSDTTICCRSKEHYLARVRVHQTMLQFQQEYDSRLDLSLNNFCKADGAVDNIQIGNHVDTNFDAEAGILFLKQY